MAAAPLDVIHWGRERARVVSWRGDPAVAYLSPTPDAPSPSSEFLRRCLETLAARGYVRVVTGALSPVEQSAFLSAGFAVHEQLHLLSLDLAELREPVPDGVPLRRGPRRRCDAVLALDRAAFTPFWQFDRDALVDALGATPASRFRVAGCRGRSPLGYAISGRASWRGFVQRLAVDPAAQGQGIGRRLLLDGLHWMRRQGARRAVVNTQLGNEAALALYRRTGFRDDPFGLSVLTAVLG